MGPRGMEGGAGEKLPASWRLNNPIFSKLTRCGNAFAAGISAAAARSRSDSGRPAETKASNSSPVLSSALMPRCAFASLAGETVLSRFSGDSICMISSRVRERIGHALSGFQQLTRDGAIPGDVDRTGRADDRQRELHPMFGVKYRHAQAADAGACHIDAAFDSALANFVQARSPLLIDVGCARQLPCARARARPIRHLAPGHGGNLLRREKRAENAS